MPLQGRTTESAPDDRHIFVSDSSEDRDTFVSVLLLSFPCFDVLREMNVTNRAEVANNIGHSRLCMIEYTDNSTTNKGILFLSCSSGAWLRVSILEQSRICADR